MDSRPDEFLNVQRALRLKRYEQPPPGYFQDFSAKVIARIEAATVEREQSWWRHLLAQLESKPVLAASYAFALGGLLFFGFNLTGYLGESAAASSRPNALPSTAASVGSPLVAPAHHALGVTPVAAIMPASSTNPVALGPPAFLLNGGSLQPVREVVGTPLPR